MVPGMVAHMAHENWWLSKALIRRACVKGGQE